MAVISIIRDTNNNVSIVRMIVSDTISDIIATNYIRNNQATINALNTGTWQWFMTDILAVACSDGNGFFTFTSNTFATLSEYTGAVSFPVSAADGGTGVSSPTAHGIAVAEGASPFNFIPLTNGQLLIGSTGVDPVAANITGGTNITVTNGAGTISISAPGVTSFTWNSVAAGSQALVANNGYVTNNGASLVTYTLPATAPLYSIIDVVGMSAGGWVIDVGTGLINFGNKTTTATTGSLSSTNQWDNVKLICVVANTTWAVLSGVGNITVV